MSVVKNEAIRKAEEEMGERSQCLVKLEYNGVRGIGTVYVHIYTLRLGNCVGYLTIPCKNYLI